jgi:predicted lipid-binding transport protein (Tim44 family)
MRRRPRNRREGQVMDPFIVFVGAIWVLWWCVKAAARPKGSDEPEAWWNLAGFGLAEAFADPAAPASPPRPAVPEAGDAAFIDSACDTYEAVLLAVARGDLSAVAGLLTPEVLADLEEALASRRRLGEVASMTLVGIASAKVVASGKSGTMEWADVHVRADVVTSVRDGSGALVRGDPGHVSQTADLWTFERSLPENGPWKLAATGVGE